MSYSYIDDLTSEFFKKTVYHYDYETLEVREDTMSHVLSECDDYGYKYDVVYVVREKDNILFDKPYELRYTFRGDKLNQKTLDCFETEDDAWLYLDKCRYEKFQESEESCQWFDSIEKLVKDYIEVAEAYSDGETVLTYDEAFQRIKDANKDFVFPQ